MRTIINGGVSYDNPWGSDPDWSLAAKSLSTVSALWGDPLRAVVPRRGQSRIAHVLAVGFWGGGSCSRWVAWCVCAAGSPGSGVGSGRVVGSSTGLLDPWCGVRCLCGVVPGHRVRPWCPRRVNVISSHLPWRNRPVRSCSWRHPPPRARRPGSTHRACAVPGSCEPGASGSVSRRRYRPDAHDQQEDYIASGGPHKLFTPQALFCVVNHNTVPCRGRP